MLISLTSRPSSKLGHVGSKTRSLGQILEKYCVHSEDAVLIQSSRNFRMLMIIISRSSSKQGHGGSKTRSLGEILEKPCVHFKRHSFDPRFMKLCQIVNHHDI